ncbi:hypothetical protein GJ744_002696 [Endocarpon pusillum]|uniref:Uncharacterized protein n=1 Tax=Endocarpon pusillum TaxID=364733 RepID=A0A8H7AMU6_9EURO|nr:hypothetical protein GJ744_002696 [Endocarpon pusillum]
MSPEIVLPRKRLVFAFAAGNGAVNAFISYHLRVLLLHVALKLVLVIKTSRAPFNLAFDVPAMTLEMLAA